MTGNGVRERGDDDLQQVGFEPWAAAARTQPLQVDALLYQRPSMHPSIYFTGNTWTISQALKIHWVLRRAVFIRQRH